MRDHLQEKSVLVLDSSWMATNVTTPKKALTDMAKGTCTAILIQGKDTFEAVSWEQWLDLTIEDGEEHVPTKRLKVKMPKVIVAVNFKKATVLARRPKVRPAEVMKVYSGRCAYTGRHVGRKGSIDHVLPRARGGKTDWSNVVWADSKVNSKKADKLPHEAGLPMPKIKKVLPRLAIVDIRRRKDRPEWDMFLLN